MKPALQITCDKLIAHLSNGHANVALEDRDARLLERIDYADNLKRAGFQEVDIVKRLIIKFNIKKTVAYEAIAAAIYTHGSMAIIDKRYEIYQLKESADRALKLAFAENKVPNILKAIEAKAKVLALLPDETENPFKNLQQNNYYMILPGAKDAPSIKMDLNKMSIIKPEELQQLLDQVNERVIDSNAEVLESQLHG